MEKSNISDAIDILREQYNAVINQEADRGFFVSLAGYVDYILEIPTLKKSVDEVMLIKQKEYEKLAELEDKAIKELERAKIKLLKVIKDNNIPPDSLGFGQTTAILQGGFKNILDQLEAFEEGTRYSVSGFKSDNLEQFLFDIASILLKLGHQSLIKDFIVSNEKYERYYYEPDSAFRITGNENGNFIFSNTLKLRRDQTKLIENAQKYELWGAFDALLKLQKAFLEKSKNISFGDMAKKYGNNTKNYQEASDAIDVVFFAEDLSAISGDKSFFASQNTQSHLKKGDFKNHLSRVNTYLLKELAKTGNKMVETTEIKATYKNGVLFFNGKEINFRNKQNQKDLLETLFKEPKKNWSYDEIQGQWDGMMEAKLIRRPENYWKKFYTAGDNINEAVAIETQIKDFVIKNTKEIRVNPEYI